ncbi:MAG TPA: hypothetical protein VHJ83_03305 [Micromonosporaceae bacterium]|nr:hypothetical protein [Micromonosporaceae bacterium]
MSNTKRRARTLLEALVRERHWTHQDFCEEYARAARKLNVAGPVTLQHVSRWLGGKLKGMPYPAQRRVLEQMFGVDAAALFAAPTSDLARYGANVSGETFDLPEGVIAMTASESARFAQFAEQTNVGPHTLEQFEADLRRIVTTYPNRPVYPMFVELRELRNRAFELSEGRQRLDQTRDLYLVAGLLCGVLANASYDLGYLDAAETQCRTAYLCAELAGHNGLKAWIRGTQSMIAYWDDRPHAALNLAVEGSRYEPETGTAGVWLAAIEARSRARLRDAAGAQSALRRAEEARAAVVGPDDPGGMMAFPEAKQMYYAATTHLWIGDPAANREAERSAEAAVRAYLEDPPERRRIGEMSLARLDLAAARLAQGDLDGTAEQVQDVLEVGARRRTESVARRLGEVAIVLERPQYRNTGLALNLHDQITDYLRTATVSALPPGNGQ